MNLPFKVLRFLALAAWELLLPDVVAKPLAVALHFYRCFLAADPRDQLALLREVRTLSEAQMDLVIDGLASAVGPFAFQLLDVAAQPVLPINTGVSNTMNVFSLQVYKYSGTAGRVEKFKTRRAKATTAPKKKS